MTKRLLLGSLLALLLLPVVQAGFPFWPEKPLGGAYTSAAQPAFSWAGLRGQTYQDSLQQYLEGRLGFRASLIRLRNQLDFSLFRAVNSPGIVVGRRGVLFETRQLLGYAGHDRLPEAVVRAQVRRLRTVQRDLARRGVQLLFVLAPNKPRFQPEDLPARWQTPPGTVTNYDLYRRALQADTVNLLNFVPLLARWKKTAPYPLFARGGTHWSGYGSALATDTLLRRLAHLGGVRFPAIRPVGRPLIVRATDSLRGYDNDLGGTLNLWQATESTPHAYPQLAFDAPPPGQARPSALFIADSFIWGLCQFAPFLGNAFSDDTRYWYYGQEVYKPDQALTPLGAAGYGPDLRQQLESRRFVVLLVTEHNLVKQEFDFTNRVYQLYHPFSDADRAAIDQLTKNLMDNELTQQPDSAWARQARGGEAYREHMRRQAEAMYQNRL